MEIPTRYTIHKIIGKGGFAVVCSATDNATPSCGTKQLPLPTPLAIKKIENIFDHMIHAKQTLRELRILGLLQHDNIMGVHDIFFAGKKTEFQDIYVASELLEADLASILKCRKISKEHCQLLLYQIFRGMFYVHSAEVLHRDLKPRNLLVNSDCHLKICDFGNACVNFKSQEFRMCPRTVYVCTRWYRAPELLCGCTNYGTAIDVWSIGCTFAEMLNGTVLFKGSDTTGQLKLIFALFGIPQDDEIQKIRNKKCQQFIRDLPSQKVQPISKVFPSASPVELDLLLGMLSFDPVRRLSIDDALAHDFMEDFRGWGDEPTREPLDPSNFEFERRRINEEALREELFLEALKYHPQRDLFSNKQLASDRRYDINNYELLEAGKAQFECIQPWLTDSQIPKAHVSASANTTVLRLLGVRPGQTQAAFVKTFSWFVNVRCLGLFILFSCFIFVGGLIIFSVGHI